MCVGALRLYLEDGSGGARNVPTDLVHQLLTHARQFSTSSCIFSVQNNYEQLIIIDVKHEQQNANHMWQMITSK